MYTMENCWRLDDERSIDALKAFTSLSGKGEVDGIEFVVKAKSRRKKPKVSADFNFDFMVALTCYKSEVARELLQRCRDDIRVFGFEYAKKHWKSFIENSLRGTGK